MVAQEGGYYRAPFYGERGVTQGYPLSYTIFNVVADAVVWVWLNIFALEEAGLECLGIAIQRMESFFYANEGLMSSTQPECLQGEFDVLTWLLDQMGLQTNVKKTVSMVF